MRDSSTYILCAGSERLEVHRRSPGRRDYALDRPTRLVGAPTDAGSPAMYLVGTSSGPPIGILRPAGSVDPEACVLYSPSVRGPGRQRDPGTVVI